jgi:acetylornithine/LysW-gamma-L-lysine aminotransferase
MNTSAHLFAVTPPRGLTLVRGAGARVWDDRGREYIDGVAGHGSLILGHGHPHVTAAVTAQASALIGCPVSFGNDVRERYLTRLVTAAPPGLDRAFLCNSGTEAVEAALKFARFATGRTGIVAAMRGFHGRTFGAMSATFNPAYREGFGPTVPGFAFARYDDEAALDAAVGPDTAAVILEVVQGEGGVHPARDAYLRFARELCTARGALLILDEVQTGFGRTGRLFACARAGVAPDLLCLAKGIAAGIPMGAVLCARHLPVPVGRHGSTFGGNPLACAAALATLEVLAAEDLPARADALGSAFRERLAALGAPDIVDVRGLGLMVGVQLRGKAAPVVRALQDGGVLALPAGPRVVRFLPPLNIPASDLDAIADALGAVLATGAGAPAHRKARS